LCFWIDCQQAFRLALTLAVAGQRRPGHNHWPALQPEQATLSVACRINSTLLALPKLRLGLALIASLHLETLLHAENAQEANWGCVARNVVSKRPVRSPTSQLSFLDMKQALTTLADAQRSAAGVLAKSAKGSSDLHQTVRLTEQAALPTKMPQYPNAGRLPARQPRASHTMAHFLPWIGSSSSRTTCRAAFLPAFRARERIRPQAQRPSMREPLAR
jgi:hypothetical protein